MVERDNAGVDDKINEIQKILKDRSTDLQRSFIILVGVGVFFFFLLLLPYYSLKLESARLSSSDWLLDDTSLLVGLLNDIVNQSTRIEQQSDHFNIEHLKIKNDIEAYSNSLNKIHYLLNGTNLTISDAGIQRLFEPVLLNPSCIQLEPASKSWVDCNLQVKNNQSALLVKNLYSSTFNAISPMQSQLVSDAQQAESVVERIRKHQLANQSSQNQDFELEEILTTITPSSQRGMDPTLTVYFSNVTNELRNLRTYLSPSTGILEFAQTLSPQTSSFATFSPREYIIQFITELDRARSSVEARVSFVVDGIKRLEGRFNQFESPFGNIPLGLNEVIVWFPFFLAAGFFVFAHILQQTMIIRKDLYGILQARSDPRSFTRADRHVTFLSSLWIDPIVPMRRQPIQLALFFVPLALFIASALSVNSIITFDNPNIREDDLFIASSAFNLTIYYWLSIVSWGLIIGGYVRILLFR